MVTVFYIKKKCDSLFFKDFFKVVYHSTDKSALLWIKLRKLKVNIDRFAHDFVV